MNKRFLSIALALVFCLTAAAVPVTFTASAETGVTENSDYYFHTDFSSADALGLSNNVLTDADGKNFYNVRYSQSSGANDGYVSGDLVTLTDGNGAEHTLMDVKFVQVTSGPKAAVIVPVDENGKPFKMEDNATYQIEYRFYVKKAYDWKRVEFGRGAVRGYHSKALNNPTFPMNYATVALDESFVTTTSYPVDAVAGTSPVSHQHQAFWPLENAFPVTVSSNRYTAANWYDKPFEGTATFTTGELAHNEDGYIYMPDTKYSGWGYYFDDYFCISTTFSYDKMEDTPPEILFDYVTIKKLVNDINLDAGEGKVNGGKTATVNAFAGDPLPVASKNGDYVFDGWYLRDSDTPVTAVTGDLSGETLYARYSEGVTPVLYDFEHDEVITTSGSGKTVPGSDGVDYTIGSWCFQTNRNSSAGIGRNGSTGLRCGAGTQTWGVNGLYPFNDGNSFCYLQPSACYTVTMDVKASITAERSASVDLVYGPFHNDGTWSTDGTKCKGTLAAAFKVTNTGVDYLDAVNVVHNSDGWDTVTYKFKTPRKFPDSEPNFPLPDILALRATWTSDATIIFDNVKVEKAPAVEFVLESGKAEKQDYFIGDTVNFPTLSGTADVIYEDGTGYTTSGKTWYKDAARTVAVGTETVGYTPLKFYEKNATLIPYNSNQVSYYGFEEGETSSAFDYLSGGYYSSTAAAVKQLNTSIPVGFGKLEKDVTYKATFFYKASSAAEVNMNGVSKTLSAASDWTRADVTFTAGGDTPDFKVISGTGVIIDTFIISKAVMPSGASVLTDEAEELAGKQAIRVFFDYVADENGKTQINGQKYDVVSRGVVIIAENALDGALTKDTQGAVVLEKTSGLNDCWSKGIETYTYSNYLSGLKLNDGTAFASVGFVTLSDGYTYYSSVQVQSVKNIKKTLYYKTNTNTYSLADAAVRENVVINTRYDILEDGITFDYTDATLRMNALCQGEGSALFTVYGVAKTDGTVSRSVIFDVFVDGEPVVWRSTVTAGNDGDTCVLKFNVGDEFKNHTIEIVRSTERGNGSLNLNSVTLRGELEKEEQRAKLVEFIGDSVTCGGCNYETWSSEGTHTYAYRTAQAIGVDYRMVSHSGTGLMYNSGGEDKVGGTWMRMYDYENYMRSTATPYTCEREADLVCIFLGTNDAGARSGGHCSWNQYDFKNGAQTLIDKVRACQQNAKIAWVINGMDPGYNTSAQYAIETLTAEGYEDLYIFDFGKCYHGGGNWHPSGEEHAEMAETMIAWFNESGILDD